MGRYFREDASGFSVGKGVQLHEYHPHDRVTGSMASHPPATLQQCGGSWVRNRSNIRELSKDLAFVLVLPHLWTWRTVTLRSCVCVMLQWGSARGIHVQA